MIPLVLSLPIEAAELSEEPSVAQSLNIEQVTVTARRRPERVFDQPVALTITRVENALTRGAPLVSDTLRGSTGVFVQQTTPGQGIPIVRGLKGSQILHLVDGMRLNNAFFRSAPNQYLGLVDALAIEQVELVRGAAGSLYGADAMGGVLQLLSPETRFSGDKTQYQGRLYTAWDSVDHGLVSRISAASGKEGFSLAGGVSWQDHRDRTTGGGSTVSPSGYTSSSADIKLLLGDPTQGEWMLNGQWLEQPSTPRIDELIAGFGQTQPSSSQYEFIPNRREFWHFRYRQRPESGQFSGLEVHVARQVIVDDRLTQDFESPVINTEQNESTLDGLTLQSSYHLDDRLELTGGFEVYRDKVRSFRQIQATDEVEPPSAVRSRFPDRSSMDSEAVYAALSWQPSARWQLDTGLRYSRFEIRLPATEASPEVDLQPNDLTGDVRMMMRINDDWQWLVNVGRGFRPPNIFDLGTLGPRPGNRFNIANPELEPETVWSYDTGLRYQSDRWEMEGFLFLLDYQDKITSVLTGETTATGRDIVRSENRNEVELKGFEWSVKSLLTPTLNAMFTLNYTYGQESSGNGFNEPADRIPPLSGQLGLNWAPAKNWLVAPYIIFADQQDRLSARDISDPRINPDGTAGWGSMNLVVSWTNQEQLSAGLRLQNIADKQYREHGSGIDAPGFNVGLWLDLSF